MTSTAVTRYYGIATSAVLAVVAYLSFTQPVAHTERPEEQAQLFAHVPAALDPDAPPPIAGPADPGHALAYMRIPRFGSDWLWTMVEGVNLDDLAKGPGHYPSTPLMGAVGNFAVAAHRATHGDPFIDFDLLRVGDTVRLEQSGAWWEYTLTTAPRIIEPDAVWVRNPHRQHRRVLTLTTCWPKYGSAKRMFVRGVLTNWSGK